MDWGCLLSETGAGTPRFFLLFACLVMLCAVALSVVSWIEYPPEASLQLALVLVGAGLSEVFALSFSSFNMSLAYPLGISAIALFGPAGAGLVAACSSGAVPDVANKRPAVVVMFNLGQLVLLACVGGWTYVLMGGPVLQQGPWSFRAFQPSDFPAAIYAMIGSAVLVSGVNLVLASTALTLYKGVPLRSVISSALRLQSSQIALAFVGFMMAQVLAVNAIALPLFVFPLVVARQLYQRYEELKEAYSDTVRSFIGAMEAKDPYTRGHSERVADYASRLGKYLSLDSVTLERLEYAALLHDLGKLAVPSPLLTKPSSLSDAERDVVRRHPGRGAEMVSSIPPLKDLAPYVGMHHEWYGGGGYPLGATHADIPLVAMILAVTDSYDAMTSSRAYRAELSREEAIAELVRGAGTQFDPDIVRTFISSGIGIEASGEAYDEVGGCIALVAPSAGGERCT